MKYTKEQLQAMSDFEVNKALAELIFNNVHSVSQNSSVQDVVVFADKGAGDIVAVAIVDYCNTPNDIMPLAFEHDIAYLKTYKTAYCKIDGQKHKQHYTDESPLRAIACCLILVLQGEK